MTINGTPSRATSTACAWRSWWGREAATHAGLCGDVAELRAHGGVRPRPPAGRTGDDAKQRSDWELGADVKPRLELLPGPLVHSDLAAPAALAAPHEQRAAAPIKIGLAQRECLVDAKAGAPQHDDQSSQAAAVYPVAGVAHDGDDLLDRGGSAG